MLYVAFARAQKVREGHGLDEAEEGLGLLRVGAAAQAAPVDADKQARKCIQADGGCGPLHDTFSTLWTDMKEMVDQKREMIKDNIEAFTHFNEAINNELKSISA